MKKRIIAIVFILMSFSFTCVSAGFEDINDTAGKDAILKLYEKGIVEGTSDTTFSPNDSLTRAQFAAFVVRAFGLPLTEKEGTFSDVDDNAWYAESVETAAEQGYISGYNGEFRPDDFVTIEETTKILVCAFENNVEEINSHMAFDTMASDLYSNTSRWAREYIGKGLMLGITPYKFKNALTVNATQFVTREEAVVMLSRVIDIVSEYNTRVYVEE